MGLDRDFPFNIEQVVGLLPIRIRRPVSNGVYTDCPFCGDNRGKLKVNYQNNTWRCNYCGEKGGMLLLYSRLNGNISNYDIDYIQINPNIIKAVMATNTVGSNSS